MSKNLQHPLDVAFNLGNTHDLGTEPDYEEMHLPAQQAGGQLVPAGEPPVDHKDDDDILVEKRLDEVYTAAIDAFNNQTAMTEIIEPRYAARNAEVAANYLNIALNAANSRAKVKTDRKRSNQFVPFAGQPGGGGKTTTNVIIANREEVLRMLTIDGEAKQV